MDLISVSAELAKVILDDRSWQLTNGYWRPSIATVEDNPAVIPGNYTLDEAVRQYGYEVEVD